MNNVMIRTFHKDPSFETFDSELERNDHSPMTRVLIKENYHHIVTMATPKRAILATVFVLGLRDFQL